MFLGKRTFDRSAIWQLSPLAFLAMTTAVCFRCGQLKGGAFLPCEACSALPQDEEELALSLAMTEQFFDLPALKRIGTSIAEGKPPELDEQTRAEMLAIIRGQDSLFSSRERSARLPRLDGADRSENDPASPIKPWWKFW
jgi:hypothetical protein